ncbi:hypothetical protein KC906_01720 [Candidatus Kaiserbacteria bacterium]|nr:hypothetical protein [Candidatus Kaiserbacteria bacterium]MCB9812389.1 hypothetical protein [Candidatus Nomurabacteria bacterium]
MQGQLNPKIVGASIIGFALVSGAFVLSDFGVKPVPVQQTAHIPNSALQRTPIAVTDSDDNGIEDWRDEFITTDPVILNKAPVDYTPPDTLTGQMSIDFMENIIRSKGYGPFGRTEAEVIDNTIEQLQLKSVNDKIYDTPDITIMEIWDNNDLVNYANTLAATIYRHNVPNMDGELEILYDVVQNGKKERLAELRTIAEVYEKYRDDTLLIPVPDFLVKQHLDLINTYNAMYHDISSMTLALEDPAVSLLRLKRYEDDASGLSLALTNMYFALEPYANLITIDDPAALFVIFSPDFQL